MKDRIAALTSEIESLDLTAVDFHDLKYFADSLSPLVIAATKARNEIDGHTRKVINAATQANKIALNAVHKRRLHEIPGEINKLEYNIRRREADYDNRVKQLRGAGISEIEINRLCPPVSDDEAQEVAAKVEVLKAESKILGEFTSSGPHYDYELLCNTALAHLAPPEADTAEGLQQAA